MKTAHKFFPLDPIRYTLAEMKRGDHVVFKCNEDKLWAIGWHDHLLGTMWLKQKRGSILVLTGQFKVAALLVVRVTNCKEKKAVLRILHGVVYAILESISVVATSAGRNTCGLFE